LGSLHLVNELLSVWEHRLDRELVVRGEELPVEKIRDLAPIHRPQLRPDRDLQLGGDAVRMHSTDANHWGTRGSDQGETATPDLPLERCSTNLGDDVPEIKKNE